MNATHSYLTPRLSELSVAEKPQERLEKHGPKALSDTELLAMILRSGSKGRNVLSVASQLLKDAGSLAGLVNWNESEFANIKGIGKVKSLQLITVVEICRRVLANRKEVEIAVEEPEAVQNLLESHTMGLEVEKFWTLCLNRKNRLIRLCETTSGTASHSLVHPREVFRDAIRFGACAIICAHNHPSGDPTPSAADVKVTRQLREAAKIVSIDFLDHIILGKKPNDPQNRGYYSFQEAGVI